MPCGECNGLGKVQKLDIMHAKKIWEVCPKCHGVPEREPLRQDGIRQAKLPCITYLWQEFKDHKPIATLELQVWPIIENGIPAVVKESPLKPPRQRIYIKIRDMNTRPKYRKQGIMDRLLICALQDRRVEWFETSWNDSTEEGRKFLMKRGFYREDSNLVFRPPEEPCGN